MGTFVYCSSLDHLKWLIPTESNSVTVSNEVLDKHTRYVVRQWIRENCKDTVLMWNGVQTPVAGQLGWSDLISPSGNGIFFFENDDDRFL